MNGKHSTLSQREDKYNRAVVQPGDRNMFITNRVAARIAWRVDAHLGNNFIESRSAIQTWGNPVMTECAGRQNYVTRAGMLALSGKSRKL